MRTVHTFGGWAVAVALAFLCLPLTAATDTTNADLLEVENRAREFVGALSRGDSLRARSEMNARLRTALSREAVARIFWDFHQAGGPVRDIGAAKATVQTDGTVLALVPLHAERASAMAEVTFERLAPLAPVSAFRLSRIEPADIAAIRRQSPASAADQPASYVNRLLFSEHPVSIPGRFGPLDGIVTLPSTAGKNAPAPAVTLVPALLFSDADGTVGESHVLRDLAQGLACQGVASVRYVPGFARYPGEFGRDKVVAMNDLLAADAIAAAVVLTAREEVDPARVTIAGWELGAWAAPGVAKATGARGVALISPAPASIDEYLRRRLAAAGLEDTGGLDGLQLIAAAEEHIGLSGALWMDARRWNPVAEYRSLRLPCAAAFGGIAGHHHADLAAWNPAPTEHTGLHRASKGYELDEWMRPREGAGFARHVGEALVNDLAFFVIRNRWPTP